MATSNFYESGNHGLNVILDDNEVGDFQVYDTLALMVDELAEVGYTADDVKNWVHTPWSFDTGIQYAVYNPDGKLTALLEVCTGYYEGANVNIYTGETLIDEIGDKGYYGITENKKFVKKVVDVVKRHTSGYNRIATFSNGETIYERV